METLLTGIMYLAFGIALLSLGLIALGYYVAQPGDAYVFRTKEEQVAESELKEKRLDKRWDDKVGYYSRQLDEQKAANTIIVKGAK